MQQKGIKEGEERLKEEKSKRGNINHAQASALAREGGSAKIRRGDLNMREIEEN